MSGHVHVIGAGLAGLSAALALTETQRRVTLYEAGPTAGGRCRSYVDRLLGCRIDNGNHLLLSGNHAAHAYLDALGTRHTLGGPGEPHFPFIDLATAEAWTLRLNLGRIPWWMLRRGARVPGTRLRDYLALLALRRPREGATLAAFAGANRLHRRLIAPLAIASLNTPLAEASAELFARILEHTLMQGGAACIPSFPRLGLSESFIDPAIARLRGRGVLVLYGHRIAALQIVDGRVTGLVTPDGMIAVGSGDAVVLAVPPTVAVQLLPELTAPVCFQAILNIHFRVEAEPGSAGFVCLVGDTAEWLFVKPGVVSVTVSAANHLIDEPAEQLAATVWPEVRATCRLSDPMPPFPRREGAPCHFRCHTGGRKTSSGCPYAARQPGAGR